MPDLQHDEPRGDDVSDAVTIQHWLVDLGLTSTAKPDGGLAVTSAGEPTASFTIAPTRPGRWDITSQRSVRLADLGVGGNNGARIEVGDLASIVRDLACGLPLVHAEVAELVDGLDVTFGAGLFDEGLSEQTFALTMSSVAKAVESCDRLCAKLRESLSASADAIDQLHRDLQADEARALEATRELADAAKPEAPPPPPPTSAFEPTHRVPMTGARAWTAPDATAPVAGELDPALSVRVTERQGDWARIVTSNGWSAWVDARQLEEQPS